MKNKDEIKQEIYELAQKISGTSSDSFLLEAAREIYEKAVLLKHADENPSPATAKKEEQIISAPEEYIKPEILPKDPSEQSVKQTTIDLFSSETAQTKAPPLPPSPEKPAPKERKESKKKTTESVAEKLQHNKITDLKASIGINEKFQFINELFEGNMKEYNVAVDQINSFVSYSEAESYISNLEEIYKWQADNQIAENFKELVQRRFA
ncbi:MAG: hypothetical protein EPN85_10945 [Bacteroidetes bacterium]|nr:MAG: hypothetical protein EPN85_10945 [Bacteroidota bacterium]